MDQAMTITDDRRAHQRIRTALQGKIVTNDRFSVMDCIVRDLSPSGARLQMPAGSYPPGEFAFDVPKKDLKVHARRIWSSGVMHGVIFYEPAVDAQMAPLTENNSQRLQQIMEAARRAIAETIGVPADVVKLTLDLPATKAEA